MPVILVTLTLTGIIWLTQSLRFVDLIVNKGLDIPTFLFLSVLIVPSLLMIILPIAVFCSIVFIYNKLISDSELIILKSAGLNKWALSSPAIMVAAIVTIIGYALSFYILPVTYGKFKDTQTFIRDNYASVLLQEGVFNNPIKGLTVYVDERNFNGMLKGILVYDSRNAERPITMMAEEGKLIETEKGPVFDLRNGNRQEINNKGNLSVLFFDQYTADISMYSKSSAVRFREPEERYIPELFNLEGVPEYIHGKLKAEGHHRIVWPLYTLCLTCLALSILLSGEFNRRGQWKRILLSIGISVTAIAIDLWLKNVIASKPLFVPLLYANPFILLAVAIFLLSTHYKFVNNTIKK